MADAGFIHRQVREEGSVGSPYAVRDYYGVNPDYGTPADLKRLVAEAHKRGLLLLTSSSTIPPDNKLITEHPDSSKKNEKGEIIPPVPYRQDVAGLDYEKPAVRNTSSRISKAGSAITTLDGFRCDVAVYRPISGKKPRAEVDKVKANTIWLAEAKRWTCS